MVYRSPAEDIPDVLLLEFRVAEFRVAESIARISSVQRERAFQAVERSYQQTARSVGYSEADAEG